ELPFGISTLREGLSRGAPHPSSLSVGRAKSWLVLEPFTVAEKRLQILLGIGGASPDPCRVSAGSRLKRPGRMPPRRTALWSSLAAIFVRTVPGTTYRP